MQYCPDTNASLLPDERSASLEHCHTHETTFDHYEEEPTHIESFHARDHPAVAPLESQRQATPRLSETYSTESLQSIANRLPTSRDRLSAHSMSIDPGDEQRPSSGEEHHDGDPESPMGRSETSLWRPLTLRMSLQIMTLALTLSFAVIVGWILLKSEANQGLMFASDINDLAWWQSFSYLYLSTLLAVLYGFLWSWIDLDIRRLEPFFQLSKAGGATADSSILLDYPFHFVAAVPTKAARRGHWSVFAGATSFILVSFILTPLQAGLFATKTVVLEETVPSSYSTGYTPIDQQQDLNAISAQYAYNVAWLNEPLKQFMTRDYILAAFGPIDSIPRVGDVGFNFSGTTVMYGVDVECEPPQDCPREEDTTSCNTKSSLCSVSDPGRGQSPGNDTSKIFRTMYVAHNEAPWSQADYYLVKDCPYTFGVRWSKGSPEAIAAGGDGARSTVLLCDSFYFQQKVEATVSMPHKKVLDIKPTGEKRALPVDMFNSTLFEWATASGTTGNEVKPNYPSTSFPEQANKLRNLPIDLQYLPEMAPFAIAAYPMPMDAYLDTEILRLSYEAAYRLLVTQQLAQILDSRQDPSTEHLGQRRYEMEAVYVVPTLAYVVIAVLSLVAGLCCWLVILTLRRRAWLSSDPGSIGALMQLVRQDRDLTALFTLLCQSNVAVLKTRLRGVRLEIRKTSSLGNAQLRLLLHHGTHPSSQQMAPTQASISGYPLSDQRSRPFELRLISGMTFLILQILALGALVGLYISTRLHNGVPLPGESRMARQLVENYVPIVTATLIEAVWMVLNRLVCLLQPWEELRRGDAKPRRSIDLNYQSLPPQLGFSKAFKARHIKLATVCLMTLLANILAVALSGVMFEDMTVIGQMNSLLPLHAPFMKNITRIDIPFNADNVGTSQGGSTADPFYQIMSNLTAATQLPPWVDNDWAYLPMNLPEDSKAEHYRFDTHGYGARLDCSPIEHAKLDYNVSAGFLNLTIPLHLADGSTITCEQTRQPRFWAATRGFMVTSPPPAPGRNSIAFGPVLSTEEPSELLTCQQHFALVWARAEVQSTSSSPRLSNQTPVIDSINHTIVVCTPKLLETSATVSVAPNGRVLRLEGTSDTKEQAPSDKNFISQANNFLIDGIPTWRNESLPSSFDEFLMTKMNASTAAFQDVEEPLPSFDDIAMNFKLLYRRLYAVLLAQNFDLLFEPASDKTDTSASKGTVYSYETRIFVSLSAFVVSVVILSLYILVTIWLYIQRPWNNLPRLPTTIASIIAYFASSNALKQMALLGDSEAEQEEMKTWRWGYGSFIGPDGNLHVGVECEKWLLRGEDTEMTAFAGAGQNGLESDLR